MLRNLVPLVPIVLALCINSAHAHFVWVAVQTDSSGQPQANVWFSELAEPDDEALIDKIAQTKVWSRTAGGDVVALTLAKEVKDGGGALVGKLPAVAEAVSARCAYGVIERRGTVFRLEYYAKYLDASSSAFKALARDEKLDLDVVPELTGGQCKLVVFWKGEPAAGSEVVVFDAAGKEHTLKTDDQGVATLPADKAGLYSIRAKWVTEESGQEGDKEYSQANHYSTLALRLPDSSRADPVGSAADQIRRAREGRAVWENFPGFQADIELFAEGRSHKGQIKVDREGKVELSGLELKDEKSLLTMLRSLVSHRLPGGSDDDAVSFAEEATGHPLGRLIKFDEDVSMGSHYRVRDDVIREVNRQTDNGRFTISVFEVRRNDEGKYLPGVYNVSFWNKDGSLRSSNTVRETWTRVGQFDLPLTHDSVAAGAGEHKNVQVLFSNHRLLDPAAAK